MAHKILLVDDDQNILEVFSRGLRKEGFEVVTACDGEDALQKVASESPEVVILDLMMPKLNGFEVLQQLRAKYKKWIPVIINSAEKDLESVRKAYTMEADHYLTKPCGIDVMVRGVNSMISLIPMRIQEA
jgi:DNA-binding response OmpR family regulator